MPLSRASEPYMYGGVMSVTTDTYLSSFDVYGYSTVAAMMSTTIRLSSDSLGTWHMGHRVVQRGGRYSCPPSTAAGISARC